MSNLWIFKQRLKNLPESIWLAFSQPKRDRLLGASIRGKRVLIVGGGPSVETLENIPKDVLVFSCNIAPLALQKRNLSLYILSKNAYDDYEDQMSPLIPTLSVDILATRDRQCISSLPFKSISHTIYERFAGRKDNYGLIRLFGVNKASAMGNDARRKSLSSGMGLLLYACIYEASEIYLAGIDLSRTGTIYSARDRDTVGGSYSHESIDHDAMKEISKTFTNVYTAVASPVEAYIPRKPLV